MREILFRGKTTKGEWVVGLPTRKHPFDREINRIQLFDDYYENDITVFFCVKDVIPETVGQYTGLTDKNGKNGKKIFEGDIVKNQYTKNEYQYFKVFYCNRTYCWLVENKYGMLGRLCNVIGDIEVIGNIHDNPELLKG